MCGGIPYILGFYVAFLYLKIGSKIDCLVYTGMYNFIKEMPAYILAVKNHCLH